MLQIVEENDKNKVKLNTLGWKTGVTACRNVDPLQQAAGSVKQFGWLHIIHINSSTTFTVAGITNAETSHA